MNDGSVLALLLLNLLRDLCDFSTVAASLLMNHFRFLQTRGRYARGGGNSNSTQVRVRRVPGRNYALYAGLKLVSISFCPAFPPPWDGWVEGTRVSGEEAWSTLLLMCHVKGCLPSCVRTQNSEWRRSPIRNENKLHCFFSLATRGKWKRRPS